MEEQLTNEELIELEEQFNENPLEENQNEVIEDED